MLLGLLALVLDGSLAQVGVGFDDEPDLNEQVRSAVSSAPLEVKQSLIPNAGRGVFALRNYAQGDVIRRSHYVATEDHGGTLQRYVFGIGDSNKSAVVLDTTSLINHNNETANVLYSVGKHEFGQDTMDFTAERAIKSGEELLIDYGYDPTLILMDQFKNKNPFPPGCGPHLCPGPHCGPHCGPSKFPPKGPSKFPPAPMGKPQAPPPGKPQAPPPTSPSAPQAPPPAPPQKNPFPNKKKCFPNCFPSAPSPPPSFSLHGDPMSKEGSSGQHLWVSSGTLTPLLKWVDPLAPGSVPMELWGKTVEDSASNSQWFDQFVIKQGAASVLEVSAQPAGPAIMSTLLEGQVVGHPAVGSTHTYDPTTRGINLDVSASNHADGGEMLSIYAGGLRIGMSSSLAAKFDDPAIRRKFAHLNVKFANGLPKECMASGVLAELSGAAPMTAATKVMLLPPNRFLHGKPQGALLA